VGPLVGGRARVRGRRSRRRTGSVRRARSPSSREPEPPARRIEVAA
jgi:hypothetical protein